MDHIPLLPILSGDLRQFQIADVSGNRGLRHLKPFPVQVICQLFLSLNIILDKAEQSQLS